MSNPTETDPTVNRWAARSKEIGIFGAIAATLLLASQLIPNSGLSALALLGAAWPGWMFVLGSSGLVASKLDGIYKTVFQIFVAVCFPAALSLYFLTDVTSLDDIFVSVTLYTLLPMAIIAYLSWVAADQLDRAVPLTGFLVAAFALFVLCFMFHNGAVTDGDYNDAESSSLAIDSDLATTNRKNGAYFSLFLLYVGTSYTGMLLKMWRQRVHEKRLLSWRAEHQN